MPGHKPERFPKQPKPDKEDQDTDAKLKSTLGKVDPSKAPPPPDPKDNK